MVRCLSVALGLALSVVTASQASANLCSSVRDGDTRSETKQEIDFFRDVTPTRDNLGRGVRGSRRWNEIILECNRQRDTNGDELKKITTDSDFRVTRDVLTEDDLPPYLVDGKYNFFGTLATQQRYNYVLDRTNGVWRMTIPYEPIINDTVENRIDLYKGTTDAAGNWGSRPRDAIGYYTGDAVVGEIPVAPTRPPWEDPDIPGAWILFEEDQINTFTTNGIERYRLASGALPVAMTKCDGAPTFFEGDEDKYDGQNNANAGKRDRDNKHISVGKIQYRYDSSTWAIPSRATITNRANWREGCRVRRNVDLYWVDPDGDVHKVKPDDWILDNFIRTAETYWTLPGWFELRLWLEGHNNTEVDRATRNLFNDNDPLKVRFATKFMPYGGNQVYKTSLIQFNNFSTMTTNGTYWHEVGHAFGFDDEYGGQKFLSSKDAKNGCDHLLYEDFVPETYQMCDVGTTAKRVIYHYIATSRYALSAICDDDSDCNRGQYCNNRLGLNRCLPDGSSIVGEACNKNRECATGKCQGSGNDRQCVCDVDSDCARGEFCNNRVSQNRCLADGSLGIGDLCVKGAECQSGSCNAGGMCQCKTDSDCPFADHYCDKGFLTIGQNLCTPIRMNHENCSRDEQCGDGNVCDGVPITGICITPNSLGLGRPCRRNSECKTDSCNTSNFCQCKDSRDCGPGRYCDTGTLGIGQNNCKNHKKAGDSCTADKQCGPSLDCKGIVPLKKCK